MIKVQGYGTFNPGERYQGLTLSRKLEGWIGHQMGRELSLQTVKLRFIFSIANN